MVKEEKYKIWTNIGNWIEPKWTNSKLDRIIRQVCLFRFGISFFLFGTLDLYNSNTFFHYFPEFREFFKNASLFGTSLFDRPLYFEGGIKIDNSYRNPWKNVMKTLFNDLFSFSLLILHYQNLVVEVTKYRV